MYVDQLQTNEKHYLLANFQSARLKRHFMRQEIKKTSSRNIMIVKQAKSESTKVVNQRTEATERIVYITFRKR